MLSRIATQATIAKNENIVARKIHDSYFLIDISDNYSYDKCALYEINETGMFIWDKIDGAHTVSDIAVALQTAIIDEVDFQILVDDVSEFIETLAAKEFVEVHVYG